MIHIVGNDDPSIPVLHTQTNPPEVSDVNGILQMAISDPDHAILNPESLANFAIGMYSPQLLLPLNYLIICPLKQSTTTALRARQKTTTIPKSHIP